VDYLFSQCGKGGRGVKTVIIEVVIVLVEMELSVVIGIVEAVEKPTAVNAIAEIGTVPLRNMSNIIQVVMIRDSSRKQIARYKPSLALLLSTKL
jgi:hypothetical protein